MSILNVSSDFSRLVVQWQLCCGRHDLPWQNTRDPYRIWLSEVMLQQTQVTTVIAYFNRFIQQFPTVHHLARATESEVMRLWAGLGYYSRAKNLLACAQKICQDHGGFFPLKVSALIGLPGIGRSTAGAILSLSHFLAAPILDGNVRRVFARYFAIFGDTTSSKVQAQLWELAEALLPEDESVAAYNQGLMDLGAQVCTRRNPSCNICPLKVGCMARTEGLVDRLPEPKLKTIRKEEYYQVLLYRCQSKIWLQPRPVRGVWSGLWMAPMLKLSCAQNQPVVIHELTHRRYFLYPEWVVNQLPDSDSLGAWFDLDLKNAPGVPACLQKILHFVQVIK